MKERLKLFNWRFLAVLFLVLLIARTLGSDLGRQQAIQESASPTPKPADYFEKKVECSSHSERIKSEVEIAGPTFRQDFLLIFYSPKVNSCLYAFRGLGHYTIRDALTNELIMQFPENESGKYGEFLVEYSGGEIKP